MKKERNVRGSFKQQQVEPKPNSSRKQLSPFEVLGS
jgi:hypothetical protein